MRARAAKGSTSYERNPEHKRAKPRRLSPIACRGFAKNLGDTEPHVEGAGLPMPPGSFSTFRVYDFPSRLTTSGAIGAIEQFLLQRFAHRSFPRTRESRNLIAKRWVPACAGMSGSKECTWNLQRKRPGIAPGPRFLSGLIGPIRSPFRRRPASGAWPAGSSSEARQPSPRW